MEKSEKRIIIAIIILTLLLVAILIYIINQEPEYDEQLYEEIYSEYNEIFEEDKNETTGVDIEINQNQINKNEKIYLMQNDNGDEYRVIAKILIPKMNIYSPVIYETTDELLKIAPTKLWGPNPNEVGNFCIIGHNYRNDQFFSNLSTLEVGDELVLKNNSGLEKKYIVYDKYEVLETDLSPTNQETNGKIEMTLITCTKNKKKRLIVKARAI